MFIDWYLPGYRAGGPIRSCANMVSQLGREFEFYIVTRDRDYQSAVPYSQIEKNNWVKGRYGEQILYIEESTMDRAFLECCQNHVQPNRIYIHGLFSPLFSIAPLRFFSKTNVPVTLAPRGMLRQAALGQKGLKKKAFLQLAKWGGLFKNLEFHATDQVEQEDIRKQFGPAAQVHLAANLPLLTTQEPEPVKKETGDLKLIFIGRIAPEKNLHFALECLRQYQNPLEFTVCGAVYDEAYHRDCLRLVDRLPKHVHVQFKEPLPPQQLLSMLSRHHALFLPTKGENFGHVIIESFMCGRPVIISDQTPWRHLEEKKIGWDLSLNEQEKFLQSIEKLADESQERYDEMQGRCFSFYRNYAENQQTRAATKALLLGRG